MISKLNIFVKNLNDDLYFWKCESGIYDLECPSEFNVKIECSEIEPIDY